MEMTVNNEDRLRKGQTTQRTWLFMLPSFRNEAMHPKPNLMKR